MKRPTDARTLTPDEFCEALAAIGWKQTEFARRTGLTQATVNAWANGRAPAPLWATAYLEAMLDLAMLHRKYLAPVPREQPATPDDSAQAPPPARLAHHLPAPPAAD
ncbi:helix-turn-helix transcriptional regulator [Ottowia sp.]|jgi:transcriptional regulator with XRE-family HTH domain|uniref:helix-turn-helix domain-containing protein n=1 Tax=Ottowia sp. TaxID=1898956 RepID=UPI002BC98CCE|nr:helix-turn-helix transcriptional regulator [Ottowia sp.]HRN76521.1 helix-turn-helix transcriptional regulator [Ottowia sp.]HRQ03711.1 helix-turn-helix transcriptional regulator [Ottowia sp.]